MSGVIFLQNSFGNENIAADHAFYSSTFHKVIFATNTVLIGLLQITPTNAGVREATLCGFLVFGLIYFVLLVSEVKLKRKKALIHHFVGHLSHLFGALAGSMLISLIFYIFALIVAVFCVFLFFFVMYFSFEKYWPPKNNQSGTDPSDQLSPV